MRCWCCRGSHGIPLHREIIDVSALAESIVQDLRQKDPSRNIEVEIQPGMAVHGDRRLINDLFVNLLANAWKFTSRTENPRIEVGLFSTRLRWPRCSSEITAPASTWRTNRNSSNLSNACTAPPNSKAHRISPPSPGHWSALAAYRGVEEVVRSARGCASGFTISDVNMITVCFCSDNGRWPDPRLSVPRDLRSGNVLPRRYKKCFMAMAIS